MEETRRSRGRPSQFDAQIALETAMELFWAQGYEGTSMAELTEAMNINKPSLYAAFGSKENLFKLALEHYLKGSISFISAALQAPTAYEVVQQLLLNSARFLTQEDKPAGCMVNLGSLSCGKEAAPVQQVLIARRKQFEAALLQRFERAQAEGELTVGTQAADLAKYVATLHQGMSIQAASGASREALEALVNMVLANWPGKKAAELHLEN